MGSGLAALLVACGPQVGAGDSSGADSTGSTSSPETATNVDTTVGTSVGTTVGSTGTTSTSTGTDDTATTEPVMTDVPTDCSTWDQDCPPGYKCTAVNNDFGSNYNDTECVPIEANAQPAGAPCSTGDDLFDGLDDCELGAMCWVETFQGEAGVCRPFCTGSEANAICEGPCEWCTISAEGVLTLCLPQCDPLASDCGEGSGCYPTNSGVFSCATDASMGETIGSACEFINICPSGLACINADVFPDCEGASGCCSPYCDVDAAVDPCEALAPGTVCRPWFPDGPEDPSCVGTGTLGVCSLP